MHFVKSENTHFYPRENTPPHSPYFSGIACTKLSVPGFRSILINWYKFIITQNESQSLFIVNFGAEKGKNIPINRDIL
jgi:hypothetical protein